jgi:hypothetical protein
MMIPIVAIIMGIGSGMLALYLNHKKRREMFALYHQERMAAIDKGIELPPLPNEFFAGDEAAARPKSGHTQLLKGLILLFVGIAVTIALYFEAPGHAWWGLAPIAIGIAFLLYYFTVGRKEAVLLEEERRAKLAETNAANQN